MYKDLEIGKARVALLKHTNMVEYTMEEHKRVFATEDIPEGMKRGELNNH